MLSKAKRGGRGKSTSKRSSRCKGQEVVGLWGSSKHRTEWLERENILGWNRGLSGARPRGLREGLESVAAKTYTPGTVPSVMCLLSHLIPPAALNRNWF